MNLRQLKLQRDLYLLLLTGNNCEQAIDDLLTSALELVVQITGARIGYIELQNAAGKRWWSTYHCCEQETATIRRRISTGIIARAIATGETIVTPSAFLDERFHNRESVREYRIEAVLCSPFRKEEIVGVIYLQGNDKTTFDNEHCMMETELFVRHITPLLRQLYFKVNSNQTSVDLRRQYDLADIVGDSTVLTTKLMEAMRIAELDVMVLLTGETGTGKGAIARSIHKNSTRKYKPFIHLNCANLTESLAESELFGAVRGAHSSAYTDIKGKISAARGGTLFLDEIGVLPITVQSKLLQFIEDGKYYPLGSTTALESDVRIISATNINFEEAIARGTFREDLYYRLNVFPIELPPLRQRKEDIPALVKLFVDKYCAVFKMSPVEIDPQVDYAMQESDWPGNVRQLENKIQQGIIRAKVTQAPRLLLHHFLPEMKEAITQTDHDATYREGKDEWEKRFLKSHLEKHNWNISETSKALDISRSHLNTLIKNHNLERQECTSEPA